MGGPWLGIWYLVITMKDRIQWIKGFACDSAAVQGAGAEEVAQKATAGAGRPSAEERIGNRYSGGHKRHENMKINEETRGGEPLNQLREMIMNKITLLVNKVIGVDLANKIISQLYCLEVS